MAYMSEVMHRLDPGRPGVFLDVGSYWGLYSLIAAQNGIKEIHAFEADLNNFAHLQTQVFLNNLRETVTVRNVAVSDKVGVLRYRPSQSIVGGNRGGAGISEAGDVVVPASPVDDLVQFEGRVIFVKMDVEGHEPQALSGMKRLIANNKVFMQVEAYEATQAKTIAMAQELGLTFVRRIEVDSYFTNVPTELA